MNFTRNYFRPTMGLIVLAMFVFGTGSIIQSVQKPIGQIGNHPNYFAQWYEEKKLKDGSIPRWRYETWAKWDKQNGLLRRSG